MFKKGFKVVMRTIMILITVLVGFIIVDKYRYNKFKNNIDKLLNNINSSNITILETRYNYIKREQILRKGNLEINNFNFEYGLLNINSDKNVLFVLYDSGYCAVKTYLKESVTIKRKSKEECIDYILPSKITLNGEEETIISTKITNYDDPLFTAIDGIKGDSNDLVSIKNNIKYGISGNYEIVYTFVNSIGTKITKKRKLIIRDTALNISVGDDAYFILMNDGTVRAIGKNDYSQMGEKSTESKNILFTVPNLENVLDIDAASGKSVRVLLNDGTVKTIGDNSYGQTGLGLSSETTTTDFTIIPNLENVAQISSGGNSVLFLMSDSTVKSLGAGSFGQLGLGTITNRANPLTIYGLSGVKQVASGSAHSLFLMNDGTVKVTGWNYYGQLGLKTTENKLSPTTIPGLSGVKEIVAGFDFSLFLMEDGTVKATGHNNYGQLGLGNTVDSLEVVDIPNLNNVKQIAVGRYHSLFLLNDGTVKAVGFNKYKQLGIDSKNYISTPTIIPNLKDVKKVFAGNNNSAFLKSDGTILVAGRNNYGQLGDETTSDNILTELK